MSEEIVLERKKDDGYLYKLEIERAEYPENPFDDDYMLMNFKAYHKDYILGNCLDKFKDRTEFLRFINNNDCFVMKVDLYEHSGIALNLYSFEEEDKWGWDNGLVGYAFCTKKEYEEKTEDINNSNWKEKAKNIFEKEMYDYQKYVNGEVYNIYECKYKECPYCKTQSIVETECLGEFYDDYLEDNLNYLENGEEWKKLIPLQCA